MSEILDLDSSSDDAAPESSASEDSLELLTETTSSSAPSEDAGHSDSGTSDFDPGQTDWLRADLQSVPEQYQPLIPLAKNLQAQFTRTQQDLADQRNQLAQERQEWTSRIQQMAAPPAPLGPIDQMRQNASEDEVRGIDAVQQIVHDHRRRWVRLIRCGRTHRRMRCAASMPCSRSSTIRSAAISMG